MPDFLTTTTVHFANIQKRMKYWLYPILFHEARFWSSIQQWNPICLHCNVMLDTETACPLDTLLWRKPYLHSVQHGVTFFTNSHPNCIIKVFGIWSYLPQHIEAVCLITLLKLLLPVYLRDCMKLGNNIQSNDFKMEARKGWLKTTAVSRY